MKLDQPHSVTKVPVGEPHPSAFLALLQRMIEQRPCPSGRERAVRHLSVRERAEEDSCARLSLSRPLRRVQTLEVQAPVRFNEAGDAVGDVANLCGRGPGPGGPELVFNRWQPAVTPQFVQPPADGAVTRREPDQFGPNDKILACCVVAGLECVVHALFDGQVLVAEDLQVAVNGDDMVNIRVNQRLAIAEIVEHQGALKAGLVGNLAHGCLGEPVPGHHGCGGQENAGASLGGLARSPHFLYYHDSQSNRGGGPMRVLALGGTGGIGRYACRIAAQLEGVDELVVADLDGDRAAQFAGQLGSGVTSMAVDVTDREALSSTLSQVDVVMNTVGPFFRFGVPILAATLDAGCHYLDICDDWEPTQTLLDLHDTAVRRGSTAIVGMGASPGISNLLAVVAARELEPPEEIVTGWNIEAARESTGSAPSAALVHGIRQMTGTIRVVRDGQLVDETPLRRITIDYPGLGRRPSWTFGHPEPLTLARAYESLTTSLNAVNASQATLTMMKSIQWLIDHHAPSADRAARATAWIERHLPAPKPSRMFNPNSLPPLFGYAAGRRKGLPAAVGAALCRFPGTTMGAATGIPLAICLKFLTDGKLSGPGVFTPESILDPDEFFAALATYSPGNPDPADMISVIRSWDPDAHAQFRAAALGARRFIDAAK